MNARTASAALAALLLVGCGTTRPSAGCPDVDAAVAIDAHPEAAPVVVSRWVDGDTVDVAASDGGVIRIRLRAVDAPEVRAYGRKGERVDRQAAERATGRAVELAPAGTVVHLYDFAGSDRYGRTVARVAVDGQDLGAMLLREGLAESWPNGGCPS